MFSKSTANLHLHNIYRLISNATLSILYRFMVVERLEVIRFVMDVNMRQGVWEVRERLLFCRLRVGTVGGVCLVDAK